MKGYLWSKRGLLAAILLCVGIYFATFALYHLPLQAVLYPTLLCLLVAAVFGVRDYLRVRERHRALQCLMHRTAEAIDSLPEADSEVEADYQAILRSLRQQTAELQAADAAHYGNMVEYFTVWAHQIKTPIAAMKLTLQQEDSPLSRRLTAELFRIEQYAEMVLTFLRLDSGDYVFREYRLDDVIRGAVRKFAAEFIGRRIRLDYEPVPDTVVTDEKWLSFVIEQVLSNALKYTPEGSIRVYIEQPKILCIADTGIGIAAADLPRIFERGYTGYNGRAERSASGIGLYLCRRICKKLGAEITAESEPGQGTTIRIDLSKYALQAE